MNEFLRRILALPPQASSFASDIDHLHYWVIGSTMVGSVIVAAVAFYFVLRYRSNDERDVALGPGASAGEGPVQWLMIGAVLVLFLTFWWVGVRQYIGLHAAPRNSIEIYLTAKQWMWKFSYPEGNNANDVLTVPLGRPVKLVMTSRDVIHSFYVPAFRIKQDVLPGRYTTVWFEATEPGEYPIYCAEFCGVSHSIMGGRVVVLRDEDYGAWLARNGRGEGGESLAERGKQVAVRHQCFSCHTIDGRNHIGPSWRGLFGSQVLLEGGATTTADEAYLTRSMMRPADDVVRGYRPVMPTYEGVLSAPDTAALVEYIRALRDAPAAEGLDLPVAQDPRTSLVGGGLANAGEGINTGVRPDASAAPSASAASPPSGAPSTPEASLAPAPGASSGHVPSRPTPATRPGIPENQP